MIFGLFAFGFIGFIGDVEKGLGACFSSSMIVSELYFFDGVNLGYKDQVP